MRSLGPRLLALPAVLVAAALAGTLALGGCGSTPADPDLAVGSPTGGADTTDCSGAIPDAVFETLGWSSPREVRADAGQCVRSAGDQGNVTVASRAVTGSVQDAYDRLCSGLKGDRVEQSVGWLDDDATGCARLLDDSGTGLAELFVLTGDDRLLQIRVSALSPTRPDRLQAGLRRLVATASSSL